MCNSIIKESLIEVELEIKCSSLKNDDTNGKWHANCDRYNCTNNSMGMNKIEVAFDISHEY